MLGEYPGEGRAHAHHVSGVRRQDDDYAASVNCVDQQAALDRERTWKLRRINLVMSSSCCGLFC